MHRKEITGYEYEKTCADYLRRMGFRHVTVTKASGDQGVDILAKRHMKTYAVQCKYYRTPVGNKAVQEVYAGMNYYGCDRAMVITNGTFTRGAYELAESLEVELVEGVEPKGRALGSMLLILLAGILWGCMGLFVRPFHEAGLDSWDIVFLRVSLTTVFMAVFILIKDKSLFRIRLRDLWCFVGTGVFSIVFFNLCYFTAITITSLAVAAILLYTAPVFVMLLSAVLFREQLTKRKLLALLLALSGLILVTGVIGGAERITGKVLLFGLGAGFGYALYSIFGRYALERGYASLTISFYTFAFATIATAPFADPAHVAANASKSFNSLALSVIFVLVSTVIPYLTYTAGLKKVENGRASIIASVEPVVATLNGILWFHEDMTLPIAAGIILVLAGISVSNRKG